MRGDRCASGNAAAAQVTSVDFDDDLNA